MKHQLLKSTMVIGLLFASIGAWAQGYTVKCSQPGTLKDALSQETQDTCTYLIVEGELNSQDIKLLRRMGGYDDGSDRVGKLQFLDLRGATCVPDTAAYLRLDVKEHDVLIWAQKGNPVGLYVKRHFMNPLEQEAEDKHFEYLRRVFTYNLKNRYTETTTTTTTKINRNLATNYIKPTYSDEHIESRVVATKNGNILLDFAAKVKASDIKKVNKNEAGLGITTIADSYIVTLSNPSGQFTESMFMQCDKLKAVCLATLPDKGCTATHTPEYYHSDLAKDAGNYFPKDLDLMLAIKAKLLDQGKISMDGSVVWKPTEKMLQTTYESEDGGIIDFSWNGYTIVDVHHKFKEAREKFVAKFKDEELWLISYLTNPRCIDPYSYSKYERKLNSNAQIYNLSDDGCIIFKGKLYRPASVDSSKSFTNAFDKNYVYKPQICEDPTTPATLKGVEAEFMNGLKNYRTNRFQELWTKTYSLTADCTRDGVLVMSKWEDIEENPKIQLVNYVSQRLPSCIQMKPAIKDGKAVITKVTIDVTLIVNPKKFPMVSLKLALNGTELELN